MLCFRRYFCLCLLLVSLFTCFSSPVSAVSDIGNNYHVYNDIKFPSLSSSVDDLQQPYPIIRYEYKSFGTTINPSNDFSGSSSKQSMKVHGYDYSFDTDTNLTVFTNWTVAKNDSKALIEKGDTALITLNDCWFGFGLAYPTTGTKQHFYPVPDIPKTATVYGKDGQTATVPCTGSKDGLTSTIDFSANITADFDIYKITFTISYEIQNYLEGFLSYYADYEYSTVFYTWFLAYAGQGPTKLGTGTPGIDSDIYNSFPLGDYSEHCWFELESLSTSESSLIKVENKLTGIISWLKSLWDGVVGIWETLLEGFERTWKVIETEIDKIGGWFEDLINYLLEMPSIIADWIGQKLEELFVPSQDVILDFKIAFEDLLSDRFGIVYDCISIINTFFDELDTASQADTINIPEVTIPVGKDETFTFGGYDVQIVPSGFRFFAELIQAFVAVLATLAFINGMRKRYDKVMG